jgi:hypothetical protein
MSTNIDLTQNKAPRIKSKHIAILVVGSAIGAVLAAFGIVSAFAVPGVSAFYIAIGFMSSMSMWFGGWGVLAQAIGGTLGGIIAGSPIPISMALNIPLGLIQGYLPAMAVRTLKMDPRLKTRRDWLIYIVVVVLINVIIPGILFSAGLAAFGILPLQVAFTVGLLSYVLGDIVVILIITTALCKGLSQFVMRTPFYIKGWWD